MKTWGQKLSRTTINAAMKPANTAEINVAIPPNAKSRLDDVQKLSPSNIISWDKVVYSTKQSPPMIVAAPVSKTRVRGFMCKKMFFDCRSFFGHPKIRNIIPS